VPAHIHLAGASLEILYERRLRAGSFSARLDGFDPQIATPRKFANMPACSPFQPPPPSRLRLSGLPDWVTEVDDMPTSTSNCSITSVATVDWVALLDRLLESCGNGDAMPPADLGRNRSVGARRVKTGPTDRLYIPDISPCEEAGRAGIFHIRPEGRLPIPAASRTNTRHRMRNRESLACWTWEPYMQQSKLLHRLLRRLSLLFLRGEQRTD